MHSSDDGKTDQFDASLQLPMGAAGGNDQAGNQKAADLIRKKIEAAYANEPDAQAEVEEVKNRGHGGRRSKHQQFIYELTNSGRPLHEVQTAWHEYYAGLTDPQKHEVWQEFYNSHAQSAQHPAIASPKAAPRPMVPKTKKISSQITRATTKKISRPKTKTHTRIARKSVKPANPLHSLLFGLGIGSITILIFLFGFFNDRLIAPFIQPSRHTNNIPLISGAAVSADPEVVIPKINAEVPVVYAVNSTDDEAIQQGLTEGVVHYPSSPNPGQNGNVVIVGHSSGNIFNLGNYKFAFSLLREMDNGDTFFLQKDGKRFTYQIYKKEVVKPTDIAVLGPTDKTATATLITCDPPGLSTNRLVLVAEQISPDPVANAPAVAATVPSNVAIIPSNSPSLWSRMVKWFKS